MESPKNRNLFHYAGTMAACAALFFSGITYAKYNDAEQLHQSAVVLHHQGGHTNRQLAEQSQLYSNQTAPDIAVGLAAAAGFGIVALGSFGIAGFVSREDQRHAEEAQLASAGAAAAPPPDLLPQEVPAIARQS